MADIKRPNYFTSQFLVEKDFNDEQSYHLSTRRRLNRVLHTSGVADGLDVTFVSATQIAIAAGTAIDKDGREIVLDAPLTYTLATAGSNLDVFVTVGYQEILDPADLYTQAGLADKFTRTTERPLVQDGTAVPPADGSVVVLARVHLNASGAIASGAAIDPTVRVPSSARIAPQAVSTTQLANASVTLAKLATDAQPLAVQGTNAITVVTDNTRKQITIGEQHSARTDNPHSTTAAQIDAQGGANQLVSQINTGSGIITRPHLETVVVSGTVTFQNLGTGIEMFSNDIDPGLGIGPLCVQLALEDAPAINITASGDTNYFRAIQLRSEVNRATGKFRVFATRNIGSLAATATVRWYAFKPTAGAVDTIAVGLVVNPPTATLINNATQTFTAVVSNSSNTAVTFSASGGTLTNSTPTSATFVPPGVSGQYQVTATSVADGSKKFVVNVTVNADITVSITQGASTTCFRGDPLVLSATVINTSNTGVTWTASGGSLSSASGPSTTFTAPFAPGTYTVTATSVADTNKRATININVPQVGISISPDSSTVTAGSSTVIRATITGTNDNRANWTSQSLAASVSPAQGSTTTWFAPGVGGFFGVSATPVADTTKSASTNITVPNVKTGGEGGGGKFVPILTEFVSPSAPASSGPVADVAAERELAPDAKADASSDAPSDDQPPAQSFVRPKKRSSPKLPPSAGDE